MTTTTREADLLAEIRTHPDDDATRLVYADLLQHDGDPRGELIAVQCALAGLGVRSGPSLSEWCSNAFLIDPDICESDEMRRLQLREAALLKAHLKEWTKEVVELVGKAASTQCRLSRGFLDHVVFSAAGEPKELEKLLFEAAPLATSVGLLGYAYGMRELGLLVRSPAFAQVRALSFGTSLGNLGDGVRILTESPRLKGLRKLEGQIRFAVSQEMRHLSRASFFGQLESLDLSGSQLTQAIPPKLPPLAELYLRNCKLGPSSAEALARCADLSGVQVLGLRDNALLSDGVSALVRSKHLGGSLRALNLRSNGLTTGNVQRLLSTTDALPELRVLDLSKIPRGAWDSAVLSKCAGLPSLIELHLEAALFDDDAIAALAQSPLFSRLRVLNLRSNVVTEKGASALAASAASEGCKNLRLLNLTSNPIRAAGKKILAESPHLAHVRVATSPL